MITGGASPGANYFNAFAGSTRAAAVQNVYDTNAGWALASANVPARFATSWTYQLSFGKGQPMLHNNAVLNTCWAAGRSTAL